MSIEDRLGADEYAYQLLRWLQTHFGPASDLPSVYTGVCCSLGMAPKPWLAAKYLNLFTGGKSLYQRV